MRLDAPGERKRGLLFVLSHMRCCTTALCHVLGNHCEIDGYFESHIRYHCKADMVQLMRRVHDATDGRMPGRFVLDKVLHNYAISTGILNREDVHVLVMLRKPEDALPSIVRMARAGPGHLRRTFAEPAKALAYYSSRLRRIQRDFEKRSEPPLLVLAESLLKNPDAVLGEVAEYLQLSHPLRNSYTLFKHSRKQGYGDMSEQLRAGTIVSSRRGSSDGVELDAALIRSGRRVYEDCLAAATRRQGALIA